ncbi:DUF2560 family protein [Serratia quinivorans]|uniref:DUF2560 family protein n=1 Tax=Serratia quinivorans TaxID=137545 RepID=UPI003F6FD365
MALTKQLEPIMAITEMTALQAMNLEIFRLAMSDTAAGEKAITFIGGDRFKYELFKDAYAKAQVEGQPVSRVDKAVKLTEEALTIFQSAS